MSSMEFDRPNQGKRRDLEKSAFADDFGEFSDFRVQSGDRHDDDKLRQLIFSMRMKAKILLGAGWCNKTFSRILGLHDSFRSIDS